jgi:DNA modification methylase
MFSFVGDTVVDPFAGTGTTLVAAAEAHRNAIGVEIDPAYHAHAAARLNDVGDLFWQPRIEVIGATDGPSQSARPKSRTRVAR